MSFPKDELCFFLREWNRPEELHKYIFILQMIDMRQKKPHLFCKLRMLLDVLLWANHIHASGCKNSVVQLHPNFFILHLLKTDLNSLMSMSEIEMWQLCPGSSLPISWRHPIFARDWNKTTSSPNLKYHPTNFRLAPYLNNSYILPLLVFQQLDDHPSRNTASYHSVCQN